MITQLKKPRIVGNLSKPPQLVELTLSDITGRTPLDVFEKKIAKIKQGKSYTLTNIQLKIWSVHKKFHLQGEQP